MFPAELYASDRDYYERGGPCHPRNCTCRACEDPANLTTGLLPRREEETLETNSLTEEDGECPW